ncbi:hypothetical protein [Escherichia coli]|nr:hypothetical protein [Escherichia coli]UAP30126.1 hypothetical protein J6O22_25705 [Escherichia coli]
MLMLSGWLVLACLRAGFTLQFGMAPALMLSGGLLLVGALAKGQKGDAAV